MSYDPKKDNRRLGYAILVGIALIIAMNAGFYYWDVQVVAAKMEAYKKATGR